MAQFELTSKIQQNNIEMKTICAVTAFKNPNDSYKMKNTTNHCNLNAKAIVIMLIIMMLTIILAKASKEKIN